MAEMILYIALLMRATLLAYGVFTSNPYPMVISIFLLLLMPLLVALP